MVATRSTFNPANIQQRPLCFWLVISGVLTTCEKLRWAARTTASRLRATALAGDTVGFSASASGSTPIYYQWFKNSSPVSGATGTSLVLTNVQPSDAASYHVTASNRVGIATSSSATLTISVVTSLPNSAFNSDRLWRRHHRRRLSSPKTTPPTDKCSARWISPTRIVAANKTAGTVKVIEIMNDLDLGWNEIGTTVQNLGSTPFRAHSTPRYSTRCLLVTGVSLIDIKPQERPDHLLGQRLHDPPRHFQHQRHANLIVRNLKFDQIWEWDEATKGEYDKNDWDFITIGNGGAVSNIWIDHCTFTKSYDGIVDTKAGCSAHHPLLVQIHRRRRRHQPQQLGVATNQRAGIQQARRYAFYNFLRNNGFSTTDIVTIIQGHDKTHLAGANDLDPNNATLTMTFHHLWLINVWDRCVPRLRAGNVHDYNFYVDDTVVLAAKTCAMRVRPP